MFKRILVPYDDSEAASAAADVAVSLALANGGAIRLVHHFDAQAFPDVAGYGLPIIESAREAADLLLARARARLQASGVPVQAALCRVIGERLGRCMAEEAESWNADLVVLGSHGRKGVARALLGSGAEQILREVPVPALVVREVMGGSTFRRILVAVDGSPTAAHALQAALALAKESGAAVRLFHSIGELAFLGDYQYGGAVIEESKGRGELILREASQAARAAGVEAQSGLGVSGLDLGEAVALEAQSWRADLVVAGTHGRAGVRRALLGSGAEQIAREAPVPVLVVRDRTPESRA